MNFQHRSTHCTTVSADWGGVPINARRVIVATLAPFFVIALMAAPLIWDAVRHAPGLA